MLLLKIASPDSRDSQLEAIIELSPRRTNCTTLSKNCKTDTSFRGLKTSCRVRITFGGRQYSKEGVGGLFRSHDQPLACAIRPSAAALHVPSLIFPPTKFQASLLNSKWTTKTNGHYPLKSLYLHLHFILILWAMVLHLLKPRLICWVQLTSRLRLAG